MLRVAPTWRLVIYGLLLLVIVIRWPEGLESALRSHVRRAMEQGASEALCSAAATTASGAGRRTSGMSADHRTARRARLGWRAVWV